MQCRASFVSSTLEVSLHKFPAKPPFDTQVAMADIVFERRGRLDNLIVLDVRALTCTRPHSMGRSCRCVSAWLHPRCRPDASHARCAASVRLSDRHRCNCRNTHRPTPEAGPQTRSRSALRSHARPRRWQRCSGHPRRRPRRTCNTRYSVNNPARRGRCRSLGGCAMLAAALSAGLLMMSLPV